MYVKDAFFTRLFCIDSFIHTLVAVTMILGLASFSKSFDDESSFPGWSYNVGWVACVLCVVSTLYFVSVAVYRIKTPPPSGGRRESKSYAPLAQFESTETDDEDL